VGINEVKKKSFSKTISFAIMVIRIWGGCS